MNIVIGPDDKISGTATVLTKEEAEAEAENTDTEEAE